MKPAVRMTKRGIFEMAISRTNPDPARILIVEDDELTAEHLRLHLLQAGYEVAGVATSGEEAIRLGRALRPDLAIMAATSGAGSPMSPPA